MIGVFNLILGGIAEMESVKDNAVKMNVPLRPGHGDEEEASRRS